MIRFRSCAASRGLAFATSGALAALVLSPVALSSPAAAAGTAAERSCSIAGNEIVRIASWDLDLAFEFTEPRAETLDDFVGMVRRIDADVIAIQGVTEGAKEVTGSLRALGESGRCYSALTGPRGYAILYDPEVLELLHSESARLDCNGSAADLPAPPGTAADDERGWQMAYFRARSEQPRDTAFDFVLLNVDIEHVPADLARTAKRVERLDRDHPWLAEERDRILIGDLAVDGARLTREFFPEAKPLINLLLKINLGLSDKSFDEAVAAARLPTAEGERFNDNILVRRWDRPGLCADQSGYCGGLEEFINARVYRPEKAGGRALEHIGTAVHPPIGARFCKFADSDPAARGPG
jgi:hypothetical protein